MLCILAEELPFALEDENSSIEDVYEAFNMQPTAVAPPVSTLALIEENSQRK